MGNSSRTGRRIVWVTGWALLAGCSLDTDALVGRRAELCADCDAGPDGAAPRPAVAVEPDRLDFGRVRVGTLAERPIVVRNDGDAPLHLGRISVDHPAFVPVVGDPEAGGADPQRVPAVLFDPDADGRPGVSPGNLFVVRVRFRPETAPAAQAVLTLVSSDPERPRIEVPLVGNAGVPCLAARPSPLTFDGVLAGRADTREVRLANCGDEPVEIGAVRLSLDSDPAFALEAPPPVPFVLPPAAPGEEAASLPVRVVFTPPTDGTYQGALVVQPATPKPPPLAVRLVGRGATNTCPRAAVAREAFEVWTGNALRLDASPSVDPDAAHRRPVLFGWRVVARPPGSAAQPAEWFEDTDDPASRGQPDDPRTAEAWFRPDAPGAYRLELRVEDELGLDSDTCGTWATVAVTALPRRGLRVELTWAPAGDAHDLDLHLLRAPGDAWFDTSDDCHYQAARPDWGRPGPPDEDDPHLDWDDRRGDYGENIHLVAPAEPAPLRVGVHYRGTAGDGAGPVLSARVRVFFDGALVAETARALLGPEHFWEPFAIDWPGRATEARDRYFDHRP